MRRRSYVALLGAGLSTGAGCAGLFEPSTSDEPTDAPASSDTATATRTEPSPGADRSTTTVGDRGVRLDDTRLAESVFLDHELFLSVFREAGEQVVVADVTVHDDDVDVGDLSFALVVDGADYPTRFDPPLVAGDATVGLSAPVAEVSGAAVRLAHRDETATYRLGEDLVSQFDDVPDFAVRSARIEAVDSAVGIRLAVENTGTRDGTFRALAAPADYEDATYPVAFDVPAGEVRTHREPLEESRDPDSVELTTDWSDDTRWFEYG